MSDLDDLEAYADPDPVRAFWRRSPCHSKPKLTLAERRARRRKKMRERYATDSERREYLKAKARERWHARKQREESGA